MDKLIMLGLASSGSMRDETAESIFNAQREGFPFPTILKFKRGPYIDHNRMGLVDLAREEKATHLMFIDTDVTFAPWAIEQLVEHEKMVVGANYNFKTLSPPGAKELGVMPLVKLWNEEGNPKNITMEDLPPTLFKAYSVPAGFMLVEMKVFDLIGHPYFANTWEGLKYTGEDVHFCEQVGKAGIEIWCDPTILIGHLGSYTY